MQTPLNQYDLISQVFKGGNDFKLFVDKVYANSKNVAYWKNDFDWGTKGISREFNVAEAEVDLFPMASVIDTNSPKPRRALQGFSLYNGKIPKMGHGYDLTEDDMVEYLGIIAAGGSINGDDFLELLFNTVDKLIFGAHSRINSMSDSAISTGHIILSTTNNPDGGIIKDFDMRIPVANKKYAGFDKGVDAVWSNDSSTPTQDIIDIKAYCIGAGIACDIMRMTEAKFLRYYTHPNTIALINGRKGNGISATATVSKSDISQFMSDMGLPEVKIMSGVAGLQTDGITANIESWDTDNITFSGRGKFGQVKTASPIEMGDPSKHAYTDGGRIQIIKYFNERQKTQGFDMECLALPVLTTAKRVVILDTETTTSWT